MKRPIISPSILSADFSKIGDEIRALEKAGADAIHYDVMDNHFVPNLTFGFKFVADAMKQTKLPADVHLMITQPSASLEKWLALKPAALTFHLEAESDPLPLIQKITEAGVRPFLSIKPATPVTALLPYLPRLSGVLLMLVEPGFGGQAMLPATVAKISELRELDKEIEIQIDGGIKAENYRELVELGADNLVIGSGIFAYEDYQQAIASFRE